MYVVYMEILHIAFATSANEISIFLHDTNEILKFLHDTMQKNTSNLNTQYMELTPTLFSLLKMIRSSSVGTWRKKIMTYVFSITVTIKVAVLLTD